MADDTETLAEPEPEAFDGLATEPLLGRYVLGERIGQGAAGVVHVARDRLGGDEVAVKMVPLSSPRTAEQLRRELATLRVLRIPGVVRLRDEGVLGRFRFVVTDLVRGEPFSVLAERGPPEAWLPSVVALLDTLARVHLAGIVHADLKPANVLVDPDGRPTVLDFGLARGRHVRLGRVGVEGTPRYMAPEQRAGGPVGPAADLYAVAGMVVEMLAGQPLADPPQVGVLEQLPAAAGRVFGRMLAAEPGDRPADALEVLQALDVDPMPDPAALLGPGPWTQAQLEGLFEDVPRSFLHLAEDGAALLFAATEGDPEGVETELRRWIRAGLARWTADGRVELTRDEIVRLEAMRPGAPEGALVALLEGGEVARATREALEQAQELSRRGALERALGLLEAAAGWARSTAEERELLEARVALRLRLRSVHHLDVALHSVGMVEGLEPALRSELERLVRGARGAVAGDAERAVEELHFRPTLLAPELRRLRLAMRTKAAQRLRVASHERVMASSAPDLAPAEALFGWAMLRYRQERYGEAAALAVDACNLARSSLLRAGHQLLAAAALVERGAWPHARQLTSDAEEVGRRCRLSQLEANARHLIAEIDYRSGQDRPADLSRVEAAATLGVSFEGRAAFIEAAHAWRSGDVGLTRHLAERSAFALRASQQRACLAVLMEALVLRLDGDSDEGSGIVDEASEHGVDFELQARALLSAVETTPARAAELLEATAHHGQDSRLDLLSMQECRRYVRSKIDDEPRRRHR